MKKYIGFIIVLFVFVLGALNAEAVVNPNLPCASTATPSITILSPNGGEVYNVGDEMKITWKTCNLGSSSEIINIGFDLVVVDNEGAAANTFLISQNGLLNDGSESVVIPSNVPTASNYKIRMYSYDPENNVNGGGPYYKVDKSDNVFTIKTPTAEVSPYIKVLSPNGGEVVNISNPLTVTFKSNNVAPVKHYINLVDVNDDHSYSLDSLLGSYGLQLTQAQINQTSQSMTVSIPASLNLNINHNYKIEICVNNLCDKSDNTFKIKSIFGSYDCMSNSSPSVTVLTPNGGEVYQAGQQIEVKWKSCNIPNTDLVDIAIQHYSPLGNGIGGANYAHNMTQLGVANDGIETVILPTQYSNRPFGKYFKVLVIKHPYSTSNTTYDTSDELFTINSSSPFSSTFPAGCNSAVGYSGTTGLPCFLDTNPATSITKNSAVLNGRLIANAPSSMYFMYKKSGNGNAIQYTNEVVQQTNGLFSISLSNLVSNTKYDFKACMNYLGAERCAKQLNFTTLTNSEIQEEIVVDNIIVQEETGCSKGEKYSSTTGQICTQYGCQHGENYSSTTGKACSKPVSIYPSGCNSLEGYSSTTGMKCVACSVSGAGCGMVSTPSGIWKILKQGVKDEEVKILQSFLNLTADGSFGPKTMNAVKLFQTEKGLTADGVVGPKTWMYINK